MFNRHERIALLSNAAFSTEGTDPAYMRGVIDTTAKVLGVEVEELANVLGIDLFPELRNLPPTKPTAPVKQVEEVALPDTITAKEGDEVVADDDAEFTRTVHLRSDANPKAAACGRTAASAVLVDDEQVDEVTCKRCPNTNKYDRAMTKWIANAEAATSQSA